MVDRRRRGTHEAREGRGGGKQPSIRVGETFEYASSTPLKTCRGTMEGFYRFVELDSRRGAGTPWEEVAISHSEDDVDAFNVEIGLFGLSESAVF